MGLWNIENKEDPGLWYVDDKAKPELLERILDKTTSPSLLLKLTDPAPSEQLLRSLKAGGWNVLVTSSEEVYRTLAYEGGLDFVIHNILREEPLRIAPGTENFDYNQIDANHVYQSISNLDKEFLQIMQPEIAFIGNDVLYNKFQGLAHEISKEMHNSLRQGMPSDNTDLVICDAKKLAKTVIAKELKKFDLPLVVINDNEKGAHILKQSDLDDASATQAVLRSTIAAYNRKDVNKPRNVIYVQGPDEDGIKKYLKSIGHRVTVLKRDKLLKVVNLERKMEGELSFLRRADAVVGYLSDEYLRFVEAIKKEVTEIAEKTADKKDEKEKNDELPTKFCAVTRGVTPFEKNIDKFRSALFLLYGGFAFVPVKHKSHDMLRIVLRNIHRKPRLPLRILYAKYEGKRHNGEKLAKIYKKAEQDLLSEELAGIYRGIYDTFDAANMARTGLPAATLAYGMFYVHQMSKRNPAITQNTLNSVAKTIRNNYDNLRKRISPYSIQRIAVESFKLLPHKEQVQNLRQQVFPVSYPPDYDFFHKPRGESEAERYLKVFDFFSRLNRRSKRIKPHWRKLDIDWSVPEKPYVVELAELFLFHKLLEEKDKENKYLLTEVEDYKSHKDLVEHLRENKDNKKVIISTFEQAVRHAARTCAQGPLLAAEQVNDVGSFWGNRFTERLRQPIGEGLSKLFEINMPAEEFGKLEQSLKAAYKYLSSEKLVKGFYSDRWPGNMGIRKNKKHYNFGYRLCYILPAVVEAVTVFQHTDYLPGNILDEKINLEQKFIRIFFEEFNNAAVTFNYQILPKYKAGLKDFICEEISQDIKSWKDLKLQARTVDKPIKDIIHMSISPRESHTRVLLYPSQKTLSQMLTAVELLPDDAPATLIYHTLQEYVANKEALSPKARKVQSLYYQAKRNFRKDKKMLYRMEEVLKNLPKDVEVNEAREALYNELYEKPHQYVSLLKSFADNMQHRQSLYEFEGSRGNFEKSLNEKYIPAYYVAMMERGVLAAATLFKNVSDLKRDPHCGSGHPFDSKHIQECLSKLELAKMAVSNSTRAAHFCHKYFLGKNDDLAYAASQIEHFDKMLYDNILTGIGKAKGIYETTTRKAAP